MQTCERQGLQRYNSNIFTCRIDGDLASRYNKVTVQPWEMEGKFYVHASAAAHR